MFTKNALLMSLALLLTSGMALAGAGLDFWVKDFESDVGGATLNPSNINSPTSAGGYWGRHNNTSDSDAIYTNIGGSYWFGGADSNVNGFTLPASASWDISIAGYTNLQFSGLFGAAQNVFEDDRGSGGPLEALEVLYKIDGGAETSLISFAALAGASGAIGAAVPSSSLYLGGVSSGAELTKAMAQFSAAINGTGTTLTLIVKGSSSATPEALAVDNLILTGEVVPEPMTMSLLALGGVGLLRRRRA